MAQMTGGEAVVQSLIAGGVSVVFGIPGTYNLAIYDALHGRPELRHITTRHEQGAAYMADGYARASGRVGVCLTVTGPGGTNALSALGQAYSDSSPVLLVQSQVPSGLVDRDLEGFHELRHSLDVFRAVTSWNARPTSVDAIPATFAEAFRRLRSGRPRPLQIEIPRDVLLAKAEVQPPPADDVERAAASPALVAEAANMLAAARRPLVYAGGGTISAGASAELRQLAELLQAPVMVSLQGKGVLPEDHPLSLGDGWYRHIVGLEALQAADLVLAVGARFDPLSSNNQTLRFAAPLIHVDVDKSEIGKHYPVALGLVGDARRVLGQILGELHERGVQRAEPWCDAAAIRRSRREALTPRVSSALRVLAALRGVLARDAIVCHDLNVVSYWAGLAFPTYEPRTFIYPTGYGCLGFGLPAALGAKVALPERQVVALAGDGGFLFTCQELATAAQYGIGVVAIVFDDRAFGAVKADQVVNYAGRCSGVDLSPVDFVGLARAFGVRGVALATTDELGPALAAALQQPGPTVIHVPSPQTPPPWIV